MITLNAGPSEPDISGQRVSFPQIFALIRFSQLYYYSFICFSMSLVPQIRQFHFIFCLNKTKKTWNIMCYLLLSSDVNECVEQKPCDTNANCTNTEGYYTCTCRTGYSGNGKTCEGYISIKTLQFNHKCKNILLIYLNYKGNQCTIQCILTDVKCTLYVNIVMSNSVSQ